MRTRDVAVHQVLATLGYGDAIGNEALGIQRVLQDAGYVSRNLRPDRRPTPGGPGGRTTGP